MTEKIADRSHRLFPGSVFLKEGCWAIRIDTQRWWILEPNAIRFVLYQTHGKTGYDTDLALNGETLFVDPEDERELILAKLNEKQRSYVSTLAVVPEWRSD